MEVIKINEDDLNSPTKKIRTLTYNTVTKTTCYFREEYKPLIIMG